jgi:hypothetical protein
MRKGINPPISAIEEKPPFGLNKAVPQPGKSESRLA